jgi:hypothetical protein
MESTSLIPPEWTAFPAELRERIGATVGRQRFMAAERDVLIVAHMVPKHDEAGRRGVLFWRNENATWHCSNGDPGESAISMHLDRFANSIEHFESQDTVATEADDYLKLLEGLAPIVRCVRNLHEVMEEARRVLKDDRSLIDHRDRAYDLSRQAELLYEDAKNAMDVAVIRKADEQARATHQMTVASHRLNMLAALFFPFATLGAIFGTTLTDNWTWSETYIPFAMFLGTGLLMGLILAAFVARNSDK